MSTIKLGEGPRNLALRQAAERKAGKLIPKTVFIDITYKCNLGCLHCGLAPYLNQKKDEELTFTEITRILDQIFKAGALGVSISGGEPLCRPDLLDILEYANKIGLFFGVKTNGTLLTEAIARTFKKLGVTVVHISLYGATPEVHEYVTGIPGSFEKTIRAIEILKTNNVRTKLNTSIMKCNFHQDMEIKALAERLGVPHHVDPLILPKYDQPGSADNLRISDEQLRQLLIQRNWMNLDVTVFGDEPDGHILCGGGRVSLCVSPYGEVFPCPVWHIPLGDLRQQSFENIWQGEAVKRLRTITINDFPGCIKCEFVKYCNRCPGLVYMENSDISGPSPENCRLARAIKGVIDDEESVR